MTPADGLETVAAIASPAAVPWRARWRRVERDVTLATLLLAVSALAWGALWWWSASPYGRYAGHGGWLEMGALADLCRAVPAGSTVVPALLHALAWVLMIAAMMLPTTFPVVTLFRRIVAGRADAGRLVALLILGFFAAWFAFGLVAHAADALVQWGAVQVPALATHGWALSALVLAGAGWFQFSALKYRCLDACHTPFAFVASRWHGRSPRREAWRLGLDHGVFCVGCCAPLMLVMFVVGTGSLGWMLALAAVMAAEKNLRGGRRLRAPLGAGLVAWAAAIVATHV
jgi:predicted metal-binding membrane protein